MSRDEIKDRILYGYYLEQLYATTTGRIDRLFSVLTFIFGSAIVLKANPFFFGVMIVIISAVQSTYQFGKQSAGASKQSFEYLRLFTNEARFSDADLKAKLIELESADNNIWSCLKPIALWKTQIKIGLPVENQEKLSRLSRFLRLLCG
jgi:hypothetical protein